MMFGHRVAIRAIAHCSRPYSLMNNIFPCSLFGKISGFTTSSLLSTKPTINCHSRESTANWSATKLEIGVNNQHLCEVKNFIIEKDYTSATKFLFKSISPPSECEDLDHFLSQLVDIESAINHDVEALKYMQNPSTYVDVCSILRQFLPETKYAPLASTSSSICLTCLNILSKLCERGAVKLWKNCDDEQMKFILPVLLKAIDTYLANKNEAGLQLSLSVLSKISYISDICATNSDQYSAILIDFLLNHTDEPAIITPILTIIIRLYTYMCNDNKYSITGAETNVKFGTVLNNLLNKHTVNEQITAQVVRFLYFIVTHSTARNKNELVEQLLIHSKMLKIELPRKLCHFTSIMAQREVNNQPHVEDINSLVAWNIAHIFAHITAHYPQHLPFFHPESKEYCYLKSIASSGNVNGAGGVAKLSLGL